MQVEQSKRDTDISMRQLFVVRMIIVHIIVID